MGSSRKLRDNRFFLAAVELIRYEETKKKAWIKNKRWEMGSGFAYLLIGVSISK